MNNDKEKNGKLSTYVVVMLLSIIIIIIIAAMADNREQKFQSQIDSTTQANMTIQNEIVTLKDDNYALTQENEKLKKQLEENTAYFDICNTLSEVIALHNANKLDDANQKFSEIDRELLPEALIPIYDTIQIYIR